MLPLSTAHFGWGVVCSCLYALFPSAGSSLAITLIAIAAPASPLALPHEHTTPDHRLLKGERMQATARRLSVVSATSCARRRLIRGVRPTPTHLMPRRTSFNSVEVVIKTDCDYDAFVDWFTGQDNHVSVLPCDTHKTHICFAPLAGSTPDAAIAQICAEFEHWPPAVRDQWRLASFRQFFIGYDTGAEPFCFVQELSAQTLTAAAALGAGIGWALYVAPHEDDYSDIPPTTP